MLDQDSKQYIKNITSTISKYKKYVFTYWKIIPDVLKALVIENSKNSSSSLNNRFHLICVEALEEFPCFPRIESGRQIRGKLAIRSMCLGVLVFFWNRQIIMCSLAYLYKITLLSDF